MRPRYLMFDVESIGLHGEGFAVGVVLIDDENMVVYADRIACLPDAAHGSDEGRAWVREHVPPIPPTHATPRDVRAAFWAVWQSVKEDGVRLVTDCGWPVEARFLAACVDDDPETRCFQGPYPLHELASFMVAAGRDPLATSDRRPDEPAHDPLGDAMQSARLLGSVLAVLGDPS